MPKAKDNNTVEIVDELKRVIDHRAFAVYYSDDNDILQAFYDTSEQQFVYTLFQPGSSYNADLTQED